MKLDNRIALITGAGSGIGRAIALLFAQEGAAVIVNDLNSRAADETMQQMGEGRGQARAFQADVSDSAQVKKMFADISAHYSRLDILVNNAGIAEVDPSKRDEINRRGDAQFAEIRAGAIQTHLDITQDMTDEAWHRMIGVHLNGTFFCTREALKLMSQRNQGTIINMASVAALAGIAMAPHYGAAKGGILSFTRSVAHEVASRNIRVNAICPGLISTPMTEIFSPTMMAALLMRIPMHRPGSPREVAATALFLASDDSSYLTGQWLSPNGGVFMG
jgi:3-oxoacyl-[acyl-carrier protein] reductase